MADNHLLSHELFHDEGPYQSVGLQSKSMD